MPAPALNTANFTTMVTGMSSSDWSTFASDLNSNWMTAWTSRFTLTTRWGTALAAISADDKAVLIFVCGKMASAITAGLSTSANGLYLDISPSGTYINNIQSGAKIEYLYAKKPSIGIVPISAVVSTWILIMNERA